MNMKFSIIITTLNKYQFIQQRLFEIYKYVPAEYIEEVIITNDDRTSKELIDVVDKHIQINDEYPIILLDHPHSTSFSANVNRGVDYSMGERIIITQDDVRVCGNFMLSLEETVRNSWNSIIGRVLDYDTGWNNIHGWIIPYIEGWFIVCPRGMWDNIGGMDEEIKPYDAEDIEWAIRVKQNGYGFVNYSSIYLQHIRGQTIQMDEHRRKITEKNIEYIRNKWSREELGRIYG